ncbi:MAG: DNA polymerase IV [Saprospiraceae bacterium]|nr:DNA polymerase IV [Saprospiraceae bacterium]
MKSSRHIVHMDIDTFFVSCQRLLDPSLNGKPVIIGGARDRGVVASCSYETRDYGVHSAMPMRVALRLCPDAVVVRGDMEFYSSKSAEVTEIIAEQAPLYEKASIDEFYLDISGMDRYFGCYKWTSELKQQIIKQSGLPISFGLSSTKTVSKMATSESKPLGQLQIPFDAVQDFLNPLPVSKIPMVGAATHKLLSRIGIRTIRTLADIPEEVLVRLLGKNGASLHRKANGIDPTPVLQHSERKSISTERTFDRDSMDIFRIKALLVQMIENLCYQLRSERKVTSNIAVKIRYTNFDTHTQQAKLAYTSCDHILIQRALELFDKVYDRRMRLRLVGVRFSGLLRGDYQINLFDDVRLIRLYQAMDHVRDRFGNHVIKRASSLNAERQIMQQENTAQKQP